MRRFACDRRAFFVLLLLCVTMLAQTSALSAQSETHRGPDHCCLLCHVGPLPFVETAVTATIAPILQVVWLALPPGIESISDPAVVPGPSRSPPSA